MEALDAHIELAQARQENLRTPRQKVWAKLLGMEGYQVRQVGKYDGVKIHVTFDNNSWTKAAYAGVSLDLSVEEIFTTLFKVDWTYQFHTALELPNNSGDNAHIYAFGHKQPKRWAQVQADNDKDDKWIKGAQDALQAELDAFIKEVKAGIKKARG